MNNPIITLVVGLIFLFPPITLAADQTITCANNNSCSSISAIFNLTEISTGNSFTRTVAIVNNRNRTLDINLTADKQAPTDDDLLSLITIEIQESEQQVKFSGFLETLLDPSTNTYLGNVPANESKLFNLTIALPQGSQDYKDKQASFDLNFNLTEDESIHKSSATVTPSPASVLGVTTKAVSPTVTPSPQPSPSKLNLPSTPIPPPTNSQILGAKTANYSWIFYLGLLFVILAIIILLLLLIKKIRKRKK